MSIAQAIIRDPGKAVLVAATQSATAVAPSSAVATLRFNGLVVEGSGGGSFNTKFKWLSRATPTIFEVRATSVSGAVPSGVDATWKDLGGVITYSRTRPINGFDVATFTVEIRRKSDAFPIGSVLFELETLREPP